MDYLNFPRKLVYRERRGLEEFAEEHEENALIIDNMLDNYYFSSANGKERALCCVNTAYYLCTIILQCKIRPEWNFAKYCDIAYCGKRDDVVSQAFTLSLVYIFLTHTSYEVTCSKLLKKLHDFLHTHTIVYNDPFLNNYYFSGVHDDLLKGTPENFIIAEEFVPRKIDKEIFRDVDGPGDQWSRKTNYYDGKEIRKIVDFLGKDEDEKHVLIELIDHDAQRFYGSDGAPYIQDVKPMLEDMDEWIYHVYNDADNQAIAEAEIEELQYQGDVRPLQARIAELEAELEKINSMKVMTAENAHEMMKGILGSDNKSDDSADDITKSVVDFTSDNSLHQQLADAQKTIEEQEATIKELNETILRYQMRGWPPTKRKGIALGLTPMQADIFGDFLANRLGIVFSNKKEELSLILNCLFGQGRSSLANKMSKVNSQDTADDRLYVASIFGPFSPKIAKEICSDWDENTHAPWNEDEENEEITD